MPKLLSTAQVRTLLEKEVRARGSQTAAAELVGVSNSYLGDVLKGRKEPGKKMLEGMGLQRRIMYQKVSP